MNVLCQDDTATYKDLCITTTSLPKNCNSYYVDKKFLDAKDTDTIDCYTCNTDFDKIPIQFFEKGLPADTSIKSTGECAPKGRWNIEEVCQKYEAPERNSDKVITNTALICATCKDTQSDKNKLPCYLGDSKGKITDPSKTC